MDYLDVRKIVEFMGLKFIKKNYSGHHGYRDEKHQFAIYGENSTAVCYRGLDGMGVAYSNDWAINNLSACRELLNQVRLEMRKDGIVK